MNYNIVGAGSEGTLLPEDESPDYIEISSVPPLPLFALLAADEDTSLFNISTAESGGQAIQNEQDYSSLLSDGITDDLDDPFSEEEVQLLPFC